MKYFFLIMIFAVACNKGSEKTPNSPEVKITRYNLTSSDGDIERYSRHCLNDQCYCLRTTYSYQTKIECSFFNEIEKEHNKLNP